MALFLVGDRRGARGGEGTEGKGHRLSATLAEEGMVWAFVTGRVGDEMDA